jgi:hypothetical protein
MKMNINDCFEHKQTASHMTKFESLKKNVVRYQHIMIMQNGILYTSQEERQKARDYKQKKKLNKLNIII